MNKQLVFGVIAVVFATAMLSSLVLDQANAHKSNRQSINQHNSASQSSTIVTGGANSPVQNSGNQNVQQSNTNNGGNAAAF